MLYVYNKEIIFLKSVNKLIDFNYNNMLKFNCFNIDIVLQVCNPCIRGESIVLLIKMNLGADSLNVLRIKYQVFIEI